ncbi:hypothetical protein HDU96_001177 [Phlyctochytrium bullatum]|nr:hypothetical protein HDU96_001177 [Phlyctochytrium bullatum]
MTNGSEIFETYEKEYATLHDSIQRKITQQIPAADPDKRKLLISQAQRELEEADEIISQMEMEIISLPQGIKSQLQPKVKAYKDEIKKAKKDLSKSGLSERDQLLGTDSSRQRADHHVVDFEAANLDQRGRLINGTERLQEGSRKLDEARKLALEAETMGINTLSELNQQRDQIIRTKEKLATADSWITKSQGVLKQLFAGMQKNKMLTYGIVGMLALMLIVIIWIKFG